MGSPRRKATVPTATAPTKATPPHPRILSISFIPRSPVQHSAQTWVTLQRHVRSLFRWASLHKCCVILSEAKDLHLIGARRSARPKTEHSAFNISHSIFND